MFPEILRKAALALGIDPAASSSLPSLSRDLARDYFQKRMLTLLPSEAASMDTRVFIGFLLLLCEKRVSLGHKDPAESPRCRLADSSWITRCDITHLNIRACAAAGQKNGTFISAAKSICVTPSSAILLAPFTACSNENIFAVNSWKVLNRDCIDQELADAGLLGWEQLELLITTAHIMEKSVGLEILPYTARFSLHAIECPEMFRWFKLDSRSHQRADSQEESKTDSFSMERALGNRYQQMFHDTVRSTARQICIKAGLMSADSPCLPNHEILLQVQEEIIQELKREGIWTLPCQAWSGIGLPELVGHDSVTGEPVLRYLNGSGESCHEDADETFTPVKLYHPIPVNRLPSGMKKPEPLEQGLNFLSNIFPELCKKLHFDFFRLLGVDRLIFSTVDSDPEFPSSDRLTPEAASEIIEKARSGKPYVAVIADRCDDDIDKFSKIGFDLTMGWEQNSIMDSTILGTSIARARRIARHNELAFGAPRSSVMMVVDCHNVASPRNLGKSHSELSGRKGMQLRYFAARFGSAGMGKRPLFDLMGNQEMSHGFLKTTFSRCNLAWGRDRKFRDTLLSMENIYNKFSHIFEGGDLSFYYFDNNFCYWYVDLAEEGKLSERIVCLVNPDHQRGPVVRNYLINVMDTANGRYRLVPAPSSLFEIDVENASMVKSPFVGGTFAFPKVGPGDMKMLYLTYRLIDSEAM